MKFIGSSAEPGIPGPQLLTPSGHGYSKSMSTPSNTPGYLLIRSTQDFASLSL